MKRIKAWAVVDKKGHLVKCTSQLANDQYEIYHRKSDAKHFATAAWEERVVPVVIEIQEET